MRVPFKLRHIGTIVALAFAVPAFAQFTPGPNPITGNVTAAQSLAAGATGTIAGTGVLTVGGGTNTVTLTATSGTTTIDNSGQLLQSGTGRTIRNNTSGTPSFVITNNSGALIRSADGDTIRADVAGSNWAITNDGTIQSLNPSAGGSQAIDFDAITTGTVSILNNASGQILASAADAVRPGANATITNKGTITSTLVGPDPSSDGIDTQARSGVSVTNTGSITGRHGITGGANNYVITVNNNAGFITGANGSGINIDNVVITSTAAVTNLAGATIRGSVSGVANGDGDGVDVDGVLTLTNFGNIFGFGAKGVGSDGLNNNAQAVSIGGGTIDNKLGGHIIGSTLAADAPNGDPTRAGEGILADNSSGGNSIALTTITNAGTIEGKTGAAIKLVSTFADKLTNEAGGTVKGAGTGAAIQMGNGANEVTNRGAIVGGNGTALDLQGGDDTLKLEGGAASIAGNVSGGTGINNIVFNLGVGSFSYSDLISNFKTVEVKSGVATMNGANRISPDSDLLLNGGTLGIANAGGANGQTFASLALSDDSTIDLNNSTSLTFNDLGTVAAGKRLQVVNYDETDSPDYVFRLLGDFSTDPDFLLLISQTSINSHIALFNFDGTFTNVTVPEPPAYAVIGLGGVLLLAFRRRRQRG